MRIGIVTTWFERGAAYVSKQYKELLEENNEIFIFARGGESYAKGDDNWDEENVFWSKKLYSPFSVFVIDKKEFVKWLKRNKIQLVLFNEQRWYMPLIWCKELNVKTVAYIDYYKENEIHLFNSYDGLICNTKRHYSVFKNHRNSIYIPWGTNVGVFNKLKNKQIQEKISFFHSCGMSPYRKGTDLIINAFSKINKPFKLVIHSQVEIRSAFPNLEREIDKMENEGKLEIIEESVKWPGLYHLGDVYVYPSRLDGIGLSLIEAIAAGLAIITTKNPPMSEFVNGNGELVEVAKYTSRFDGYYWPYSHVSIESLIEKVEFMIDNKSIVHRYKEKSSELALHNFNWSNNKKKLESFLSRTLNLNCENDDMNIRNIIKYENEGFKYLNKYVVKYQSIFQFCKGVIFKFKSRLWN